MTERQQTEAALRESEERFSAITRSAKDGIIMLDTHGNVCLWNPAAEQLTGYPADEIMGRNFHEVVVPPRYLAEHRNAFAHWQKTGLGNAVGKTLELSIVRKDGIEVSVELSLSSSVISNQQYAIGLVRDITERKCAEEALLESEERYRTIMESVKLGVSLIDVNHKIIMANSFFADLFKKPAADFVGRYCFMEFEKRAAICPHCPGVLTMASGKPAEVETEGILDDGSCFNVLVRTVPTFASDGTVSGFVEVIEDITERKLAEENKEKTLLRQQGISQLRQSLLAPAPLEDRLRKVTDAIVRLFDADFCRIWLIRPGDLCEQGCIHAEVHDGPHVCQHRDRCLHLLTSSGRYTHVDGQGHRRVPFGCYKIGLVASGDEHKFVTNDAQNDPHVHDHAWVRELGLVSFAGYQLRAPGGETLGVLALFSKRPISVDEDAILEGIGSTVALVVKQAAAEEMLLRSETKFRALYDSTDDAVMLLDERGFFDCNRATLTIFGCATSEEFCLKHPADLSPSEQPCGTDSFTLANRRIAIAMEKGSNHFEWIHKRVDTGEPFYADVLINAMELDGKPIVQAVVRDITERKRAEEALRASQQMIEGIINAIPVRVFWKDRNLVYLGCNAIFARDAGFTDPKDIIGKDDYQMGWRDQAGLYRDLDRQIIDGGNSKLLVEESQTTPEGSTITLLTSKIPLRTSTGEISGVLGIYMDITDQKYAAEAIREQLRFLQVIIDAIPTPVFFKDADGRYQGCNKAFADSLGSTRDDLIGKTVYDTTSPELAKLHVEADRELLESGRMQIHESKVRYHDGTQHDVVSYKATYDDAEGRVAGLVGTMLDITERKRAEDALREREAEHRMLFDGASVGITYVDLEKRVLMMNSLAAGQMGGKPEDFIGRPANEILPPDVAAVFHAKVDEVSRENTVAESEDLIQSPEGSHWYIAKYAGIREPNGMLIGVQIVTTDITERKNAEAALKLDSERMQVLLSINRMTEVDSKEVIAYAIEAGIRLTGSKLGYMASMNEDETVLTMEYWSKDAMRECAVIDKPIVYQLKDTGLWGEAVRQRRPVITNDYAAPNPLKKGHPEGHVHVVRHMSVPIFDGDRIVAVAGVGNKEHDYAESDTHQLQLLLEAAWRIIDRARAEIELRDSEERFRNVIKNQGEGIGIVNTEERFTFANPAAERIFGVEPGALVGRSVLDFVSQDARRRIQAETAERATGVDSSYELEITRADGQCRSLLITATPQFDEDGVFAGSFGVFRDITERKHAEDELRKLSQAVEQSPTSVVVTDVYGSIEYVNPKFCELTGYTSAEAIGQNPRILNSGLTPKETYDQMWSTIGAGHVWTGEFLNRKKTGEPFWERANISGIKDAAGTVTHYIALKEDITEQKRVEEERTRFIAVIDEAPESIAILNADGSIMYVNHAFERISGVASGQAVGHYYEALARKLYADNDYGIPWDRVQAGESWTATITYRGSDGEFLLMDQSISAIRSRSGEIINYVLFNRDVTEERELEIRARWADERLRLSIDGMFDGLTLWDVHTAPDGSIQEFVCSEANPAALMMLGKERQGAVGYSVRELLKGAEGSDPHGLFLRVRDRGQSLTVDHLHLLKGNQRLIVTIHVWPIGTGVACHLRDVTQQLELETQLRQAQKLEAVGSLAAGIAHEINTPIQFVGDNIRFLADSFTGLMNVLEHHRVCRERMAPLLGEQEELQQLRDLDKQVDIDYLKTEIPLAVEQSLEGVSRVSTIVRAMKDFSHIDEREMVLADINQMLDTTLTVARNELKYVADVTKDFAPDLPTVECFRNDLNQVFLNLLVNAAHAISDVVSAEGQGRGTITVATRRDGDEVVVSISDTGGGIPEGIRDRIFDHFFTTKEVGKGTGQGLSIARSIVVEKHKGAITFDSEIGKGTTFHIRLPITRKEVEHAESQHPVRG